MSDRETIMFRFVPTMRCNFRCEYCFVGNDIKSNGATMFDFHSVEEWAAGMDAFSDYDIELYFWGGEPFCIDETYDLIKEWVKRENIISGFRIDTNTYFAEKIADRCPSSKIKLNCSYHMQYHTLDEEYRKIKLLKEHDMVGMVNFVASKYNLEHLRNDYGMTVNDLIEKFADIGVFVNIAGDFAYANNSKYEKHEAYRDFILQFISPEEWKWLRGVREPRNCTAGLHMFTVEHNGDFTCCVDKKIRGNFFRGELNRDSDVSVCGKNCPSLVAYPFRCDNDFPTVNSLIEYVRRNESYRKSAAYEYKDFVF